MFAIHAFNYYLLCVLICICTIAPSIAVVALAFGIALFVLYFSRPLINQILLSCKFQPESVTLDSKSIVNINISSHLIIRQS